MKTIEEEFDVKYSTIKEKSVRFRDIYSMVYFYFLKDEQKKLIMARISYSFVPPRGHVKFVN